MRFDLTTEQQAFQQEVEVFLAEHLPADVAAKVKRGAGVSKEELTQWTRILNAKGWAVPAWPVNTVAQVGILCSVISLMWPVVWPMRRRCPASVLTWSGRPLSSSALPSSRPNGCPKS